MHECIRYVMWNPVRAGVADDPWQSRWTSCRASAGLERPHPALALNRLLAIVGSVAAFAALVDSGRELR